jgi:hypothetical protein
MKDEKNIMIHRTVQRRVLFILHPSAFILFTYFFNSPTPAIAPVTTVSPSVSP